VDVEWEVEAVHPLEDYEILVELADGRRGIFDLKSYLDHGIFRELRDQSYFAQAAVMLGAMTWPHGQDIAEALMDGLRAVPGAECAPGRINPGNGAFVP
jgi:hypothetical protein